MHAPERGPTANGVMPVWNVPQRVAATLLLALHAALAWSMRVPGLTTGHDDAWYLSLARAIRLGRYADLPIVGTPTHAMYPPLYPALLALLGVDRPETIVVGVAINIALSVLALAFAARLAGRIAPGYAVAMLVVCAPNPLLLERASSISSEPLFMAATFLALWLLTGADADVPDVSTGSRGIASNTVRGRQTRAIVLGTVAVLAATLSRSIGLALLLATLAHWLLARRWRRVGMLAVAGALTTGAWLLWTVRAPRLDAGRSYIADAVYTGVAPTKTMDTGSPPTPSLVRVLVDRVRRSVPAYVTREFPSAVAVPTVRDTRLDNLVWMALLLGGGLAGLLLVLRPLRLAVLFLAIYVGVLCVWPYVLERFLAPVLPLLVLLVVAGVGGAVERVMRVLRRRRERAGVDSVAGSGGGRGTGVAVGVVLGVVAAGIALGALERDAATLRALAACDRRAPTTSAGCFSDEQRDFFAAAEVARRVAPDSARFLSSKEATLYQLTGRQSVREAHALAIADPAQFAAFLKNEGVGYILLSRLHLDQWSLADRLAARCGDYAVVQTFGVHVALLRVRAPADAPRSDEVDGCAAIDRWARGDWES